MERAIHTPIQDVRLGLVTGATTSLKSVERSKRWPGGGRLVHALAARRCGNFPAGCEIVRVRKCGASALRDFFTIRHIHRVVRRLP